MIDEGFKYQLVLRQHRLAELCVTWRKSVEGLSTGDHPLRAWGPSDDELLDVRVSRITAAVIDLDDVVDGDDDAYGVEFEVADGENVDVDLMNALDVVDAADNLDLY